MPRSKPRQALDRVFREGKVLLSSGTLTKKDARSFVAALARESEWIDLNVQIKICRDPKDDKFLKVAVSGQATEVITGDADLLVLDPFQGIRILSPQDFLDLASPLPR
jgi:predicted nucleic acid-binding protein